MAANIENWRASGGMGFTVPGVDGVDEEYAVLARGMKDATTREHTYKTIFIVHHASIYEFTCQTRWK